jgi:hypothetical protein
MATAIISYGGIMRNDVFTKALLGVIAVALTAIAIRPYIQPAPAQAESQLAHSFYIEPGIQMLRIYDGNGQVSGQVYGKLVVDMRNGKIWGFPTGSLDAYPSNALEGKPVTSHAIALGRYAFEETDK